MKKTIKIIGLVLLILVVLAAGYLLWGLHRYVQDTPRITPYADVVITRGQTVTPDDVALIERSHGTRITDARWENGNTLGIVLSEDGSSFTVTEGEGIIHVLLYAAKGDSGENAYKTVEIYCR